MKTLKRKLTRPMCLILALLVMSGSMLAAAMTGSPYEALKDAAFDLLTAESATIRYTGELLVNGEPYQDNGLETQYTQFSSDGMYSDNGSYKSYRKHNLSLNNYGTYGDDRDGWWSASYLPGERVYHNVMTLGMSRGDMYVRLAELTLDLLAGDLKNNIGMTYADGLRTISATFTAQQIPELYNAALTVLLSGQGQYNVTTVDTLSSTDTTRHIRETRFEGREKVVTEMKETGYWYYYDPATGEAIDADDPRASAEYGWFTRTLESQILSQTRTPATREDYMRQSYSSSEDILNIPVEKAVIDYAYALARVDGDGHLTEGTASLRFLLTNIFGEEIEVELNLDLTVENVNSTDPQCPVADAHEVFTEELFQEMYAELEAYAGRAPYDARGGYYDGLEFTLNPDGTVNRDSIRLPSYAFVKDQPLLSVGDEKYFLSDGEIADPRAVDAMKRADDAKLEE
ncbi:MAG: hypothetical protein FWG93_05650 [Oscillospiraceae bacterium]|nr:hypothetical protein [Oscillospiraceae bacterium]